MRSQYNNTLHDQLCSEVISSSLGELPEEQKHSSCFDRLRTKEQTEKVAQEKRLKEAIVYLMMKQREK